MIVPRFNIQSMSESTLRDNWQRLTAFLVKESPLLGFRFLSVTISSPGTVKYAHGLGFQPRDIVLTSKTGPGAAVFNYDEFDITHLSITAYGPITQQNPVTLRLFAGTYNASPTSS